MLLSDDHEESLRESLAQCAVIWLFDHRLFYGYSSVGKQMRRNEEVCRHPPPKPNLQTDTARYEAHFQ